VSNGASDAMIFRVRRHAVTIGAFGLATLTGLLDLVVEASPTVVFIVSGLALAGLASVIAHATEALGERFGPSVTGILQATLGNLPELFIVLFSLSAGELVVAQYSIIGSLFANALLILGLVIVAGARKSDDGVMRFHARLPNDAATLLLVAVFVIVLLGVSVSTQDEASDHPVAISTIGSLVLLAVYASWLVVHLKRSREEAVGMGVQRPAGHHGSLRRALVTLGAASGAAALVADWFIGALEPTSESLGIPKAFAGLVIVAIAGNAVEQTTAIVLAWKGKADLAIAVVKSSVSQIAVFLFPVLILASLLFAQPLTFVLPPVFIAALLITAIAVWQITGDGEAALYEGIALIGIYVILAGLTFFE
jgi:Ca2+:H+ antiporter